MENRVRWIEMGQEGITRSRMWFCCELENLHVGLD